MKRVFKFAMPFLQASLVKQILVGLILGMALGLTFPDAAKSVGFLGTVFVMALKGVAPILVFVLVMSSIANQSDISQGNMHVKPIIVLYLVGTFLAAVIAVGASFLWPTEITLQAAQDTVATPGGIAEVFGNLILQAVEIPCMLSLVATTSVSSCGLSPWGLYCVSRIAQRVKFCLMPLKQWNLLFAW